MPSVLPEPAQDLPLHPLGHRGVVPDDIGGLEVVARHAVELILGLGHVEVLPLVSQEGVLLVVLPAFALTIDALDEDIPSALRAAQRVDPLELAPLRLAQRQRDGRGDGRHRRRLRLG